jgi:hypothetical protein
MAFWLPAREPFGKDPTGERFEGERFLLPKTITRPGTTETSCSPGPAQCCGQTVDELVQWMEQEASPGRL